MEIKNAVKILNDLFSQLKLKAIIQNCQIEDAFLIFDIKLISGGTFKKLEKHATEIALALKSLSIPLIYPLTQDGIVKMEVMISEQKTIFFKDIILNKEFIESKYKLPLILGSLRNGDNLIIDLIKMPHLLISGSTGSGKSILLQSIINSLIFSETKINFALIDPKRVEFSYYDGLNNLYAPIAKNTESSLGLLTKLIEEMDRRFILLEKSGSRDISTFNGNMPYIVVIIDELADLMIASKKEAQELICRLAQKSRACGIHLIIATQRPSVDVVTGLIKVNFPARLSCRVSSSIDSRTILDRNGAETLIGNGDAILDCVDFRFRRFKGAFITEKEIIENIRRAQRSKWLKKIWSF